MAAADPFTVFFTGKQDDPRHGLIVIGEAPRPVFFRFDTPDAFLSLETRTTVYRNNDEPVATFEWSAGTYFGAATILARRVDMSHLVLRGSSLNSRRFFSADTFAYEWRKTNNDAYAYDLYALHTGRRIAEYRRVYHDTTVGPSHAILHLWFDNELLLLESLLALTLNRWIDRYGL